MNGGELRIYLDRKSGHGNNEVWGGEGVGPRKEGEVCGGREMESTIYGARSRQ